MLARWRRLNRHVRSISSHVRHISDLRPFQPGDLVLLREKLNRSAPPILTRPLKPSGQVQSHKGILKHDELIGKRVRDVVATTFTTKNGPSQKVGTEYRLHEVKLEEYVRLSRRLVTPVYPADARLIVELLDLHPECANEGNGEKLEILEAGTGHGALTLYLSRAIHGANPALPDPSSPNTAEDVETWKRTRRAVIHTLDVVEKYSLHARSVVQGFRHGLYYPNIDFHVSDVSVWLKAELASRSGVPFLSHAILDLPNSHLKLQDVAAALRVDGTLVVFNPSITQVMQCAAAIRQDGIPLELEKVVELPTNGEAGGREWSVRAVRPRASVKGIGVFADEGVNAEDAGNEGESLPALDESDAEPSDSDTAEIRPAASHAAKDEGWQMICRPKVGDRIIGGGFVGVFRKQRARNP